MGGDRLLRCHEATDLEIKSNEEVMLLRAETVIGVVA